MDDIDLEIARSYLLSTVRQMVQTTVRCAYSTCFSEGEDFTCGLFDANGRLAIQVSGLPVQIGTLEEGLSAIRVRFPPDEMGPGDIFLHNDPNDGGSHKPDVLVAMPLFSGDCLLGFAVNKGHWTDIGGVTIGGWDGSATSSREEGLVLPAIRLYRAGILNESLRDLIFANINEPRVAWGDLSAQIASARVAQERIAELEERIGTAGVTDTFRESQDYSRRRLLERLKDFPSGSATASDVIGDDLPEGPLNIVASVEVTPGGIIVDFEGTDPAFPSLVNATHATSAAAAYAASIAMIDPEIPISAGCLDLIDVRIPKGSLLWPGSDVPMYAATADPCNRAAETVMRAFADLSPESAIAGTYATGNNTVGSGHDATGERFLWYIFESGGCGARSFADGNSAEWHLMSNCRNESMEVWEHRYPVLFTRYALMPDTGGPGRYRGGLGVERWIKMLVPTTVAGVSDRQVVPPWGVFGGKAGTTNAFRIVSNGSEREPEELGAYANGKFGPLPLMKDDVYVIRQGGGGGYGPPFERDLLAIEADLADGYVSPTHAMQEYGVAVAEDGSVSRLENTRKGEESTIW